MNISLQQKRELLEELIKDFEEATYSSGKKQQLLDQARAKLQFITPEKAQETLMLIDGPATFKAVKRTREEELQYARNHFERFKNRALSKLNTLLIEIDLTQKYSTDEPALIPQSEPLKEKVFIVHGHDDALKNEVARFVEQQGLEVIILHERSSQGQTIIEKIEANSDVGFAIVLYTPCDLGRSVSTTEEQPRARQNVIFEHGYFVAKLGRRNVVALNKGKVEVPNDLSGMIYVHYDQNNWKRDIAHELHDSGYKIDFQKI